MGACDDLKRVREFRHIVLWPLELVPNGADSQVQRHWEVLERCGPDTPWHEIADEFTGDPLQFQVRHYTELVTFLPYVQRFLYGEGRFGRADDESANSPMRVFRRDDIVAVRLTLRAGDEPLVLSIAHIDLYFFFDIDVVLLNVEIFGSDLPLGLAQEVLYRFGRAYPAGWDDDGRGLHCAQHVEWLGRDGTVLAASDAHERARYLSFVCQHRTPLISAHWAYLMHPLVPAYGEEPGPIRFRTIEYYRMPLMAYLAVEDPRALTRSDFVRLGHITTASGDDALPYSERHLADFEERYCYDRFWSERSDGPSTRYMCSGHAMVVVGAASAGFFVDPHTGVLAQFRHQHFLLFLIAHFQRAALLMFSERLVDALKHLDISEPGSVKRFKRAIRQAFEVFLRFTHRYWFHEIADQAQAKGLFHLCARHLALDPLYAEVRERMRDMTDYLETDSHRRQANSVVRLTVVTIFGMIGTVATGLLGMNLLAESDSSLTRRIVMFSIVLLAMVYLTMYTVLKSKHLSDFLDALSDERLSVRAKLRALLVVWKRTR